MTDPSTGVTKVITTVPVYYELRGRSAVDRHRPGLRRRTTGSTWYYAPPLSGTPTGSAPNTLPAGAGRAVLGAVEGLQPAVPLQVDRRQHSTCPPSRQIIDIPSQRGQCCHVAGDFDWDAEGNLYLATGDNTPAGAPGANGYAPNNDAPGHEPGPRLAARRGQHQRPARQDPADRRRRRTAPTRSPRATCSRSGRRRPVPRSS